MSNELLLALSVFIYFGGMILLYYLFGKKGLLVWNCIALIMANIEVTALIDAFGLTMTLGNICFASTFLVTDLICEKYSKREADMVILISFLVSIIFVLITQFWLLFTPASTDTMMPHFVEIFSNTPRVILSGLIVRLLVQILDVRFYYFVWNVTKKINKNQKRFLWARNNISTIASQFINAVLFNILAFYGVFSMPDLLNVMISTFLISVVTSLIDTPFLYFARRIEPRNLLSELDKQ